MADEGIKYFFTDTHGLMNASIKPKNGVYAPIDCGNGVMAFARDPDSSQQVWDSQQGYPGDENYREYYSDIGFDSSLDLAYLSPYILDGKTRINTGIKYHRVSAEGETKELYNPKSARLKAQNDARDFIINRQLQLDKLSADMDRMALIVSPYDAELFGHWWAEGPYGLIRY